MHVASGRGRVAAPCAARTATAATPTAPEAGRCCSGSLVHGSTFLRLLCRCSLRRRRCRQGRKCHAFQRMVQSSSGRSAGRRGQHGAQGASCHCCQGCRVMRTARPTADVATAAQRSVALRLARQQRIQCCQRRRRQGQWPPRLPNGKGIHCVAVQAGGGRSGCAGVGEPSTRRDDALRQVAHASVSVAHPRPHRRVHALHLGSRSRHDGAGELLQRRALDDLGHAAAGAGRIHRRRTGRAGAVVAALRTGVSAGQGLATALVTAGQRVDAGLSHVGRRQRQHGDLASPRPRRWLHRARRHGHTCQSCAHLHQLLQLGEGRAATGARRNHRRVQVALVAVARVTTALARVVATGQRPATPAATRERRISRNASLFCRGRGVGILARDGVTCTSQRDHDLVQRLAARVHLSSRLRCGGWAHLGGGG